jgi:hypothetical protein
MDEVDSARRRRLAFNLLNDRLREAG